MAWLNRPLAEAIGFRERADACRRARLIRGILAADCRVCAATAGTGCDPYLVRGAEVVRLDRDPLLFAHSERLACSVFLGFIPGKLVRAQFGGGTLPAGLP